MPEQRYRFIHFVKKPEMRRVWSCRNNKSGAEIGMVYYYVPWRRMCFFPAPNTVLSEDCHADIGEFLRGLRRRAEVQRGRQ